MKNDGAVITDDVDEENMENSVWYTLDVIYDNANIRRKELNWVYETLGQPGLTWYSMPNSGLLAIWACLLIYTTSMSLSLWRNIKCSTDKIARLGLLFLCRSWWQNVMNKCTLSRHQRFSPQITVFMSILALRKLRAIWIASLFWKCNFKKSLYAPLAQNL